MICFNNNCVFSAFFLFFLLCLAKSDENLISTLCSKTVEPVICSDCLHSVPKGPYVDGKGLALIGLDCAEADATKLQNGASDIAQNATGEVKKALDDCGGLLNTAQQEFSQVKDNVEGGDYDTASRTLLTEIVPFVTSCLRLYPTSLPVPDVILAGTVAANQTSNIAASILANI